MPEQVRWKPVVGYEAIYEVSDDGRVRSSRGEVSRWCTPDGHHRVTLRKDGRPRHHLVHRLMLTAFVGPCPAGQEALHSDDIPDHNVLSNLQWGTRSQNQLDSVRNGTHNQASKTHCPRGHLLSEDNLLASKLKQGKRACRECSNTQDRQRRKAKTDARTR